MSKVEIYDTTLRDGAQAEGISLSVEDKLMIAQKLDQLGVHYIEGGWPNPTNHGDLEFFVRAKNCRFRTAKITAFGSTRRAANKPEEDVILDTLLRAETEVVTIFGKSWDLHVTKVLKTTLDENLKMIEDSVVFLGSQGRRVIYDAEHFFDGYRSNPQYVLKTLAAAQNGGAEILVLCDTNGGYLPLDVKQIIEQVEAEITVPFGIHAHNDSGMADANSIIAVELGAVQVQGTFGGWGERCGNANLTTVIPNIMLKLRKDCISKEALQDLVEVSRFVSEVANVAHDFRQPYVGESAFAHKGGAHIDGVLKLSKSFEHIDPKLVGNERRLLLSEQSGGSTVAKKLQKLYPGVKKGDPIVSQVLAEVKRLENQGYQFEAASASFEILARKLLEKYEDPFQLEGFRTIVEKRKDGRVLSEATVRVVVDGEEQYMAAEGDGPVNALDTALRKALEKVYPCLTGVHLRDYKVRVLSSSTGTAAKVRVLIQSSDGTDVWGTVGVSEDIIEASWEALADSMGYKILKDKEKHR